MSLRPPLWARALRAAARLLLLAAVAATGCMSDQERAEKHVERARHYLEEGDRDEAVLELQSALQRDPESEEANTLLAGLAVAEGRYHDAVAYFREAHRAAPESAKAALNLAKILQQDDPQRARQLVEEIVQREPGNPLGYIGRAELALGRGDTRGALKAAEQAAAAAPDDPRVHALLASIYQGKIWERRRLGLNPSDGLYEGALDALARYAELSDEAPWKTELQRAEIFAAWPEHESGAEERYSSALELAEGEERPAARREVAERAARFATRARRPDFLEWALQKLVSSNPGDLRAWFELARLRERRGGSGDAVLQRMLTQQADNPEAHIRWAEHLVAHRELQQAIDYLSQKAEEEIDPPRLLAALANLQLAAGRYRDSRRTTRQLEARYPGHPWTILEVAQLAVREGRIRAALEALRRLAVEHESVDALRMLAEVELLVGNDERALRAADRAVQLQRGFAPREQRLRARILSAQGEYRQARRVLGQLEERQQLLPEGQVVLAKAYYETNEPSRGRALLEELLSRPGFPIQAALEFAAREGSQLEARDEARRHLLQALRRAPNQPTVLDALVALEVESGQIDRAFAHLDRALERAPESAPVLLRRARLHAAHGKVSDAIADARAAFGLQPNLTGALRLLSSLLAAHGRLQAEIAALEQADRSGHPITPNTRALLARLYLLSGDEASARVAYERALSEGSILAEAKKDLALLLIRGDGGDAAINERALKLAREAAAVMSDDEEAIDTLGLAYLRRGDAETALDYFRHALQLADPARPSLHYHSGLALRALHRDEEAIRAFRTALASGADFREAVEAQRQLELASGPDDEEPGS